MRVDHGSTSKTAASLQRAASAGTTRFIARNLFIASRDRRSAALLASETGDLLQKLLLAAGDRTFVRAAQSRAFRAVFRLAADLVLPGISLHYLARKRCLEDWVRRACGPAEKTGAGGGCRQVVVLGAGLDVLAWRLHREWPAVQFIELDRPAALHVKKSALAAGKATPGNLAFLPADLADETLAQALGRSPAFDPALPALFLIEGVLMYLPPGRVASLLAEIAVSGTRQGQKFLAFTFMEERADGRIRFRRSNPLVNWWLRWQGEPFRWAHDPRTLAALLERTGWRLRELVSGDDLRVRYLQPAGLGAAAPAMGEWLALAEAKGAP